MLDATCLPLFLAELRLRPIAPDIMGVLTPETCEPFGSFSLKPSSNASEAELIFSYRRARPPALEGEAPHQNDRTTSHLEDGCTRTRREEGHAQDGAQDGAGSAFG